jgi:hypothetical protein
MAYVSDHALEVSLAAIGVLAAGFAAYLLWTKAQARKSR